MLKFIRFLLDLQKLNMLQIITEIFIFIIDGGNSFIIKQ